MTSWVGYMHCCCRRSQWRRPWSYLWKQPLLKLPRVYFVCRLFLVDLFSRPRILQGYIVSEAASVVDVSRPPCHFVLFLLLLSASRFTRFSSCFSQYRTDKSHFRPIEFFILAILYIVEKKVMRIRAIYTTTTTLLLYRFLLRVVVKKVFCWFCAYNSIAELK
jgi:hypothetical protein